MTRPGTDATAVPTDVATFVTAAAAFDAGFERIHHWWMRRRNGSGPFDVGAMGCVAGVAGAGADAVGWVVGLDAASVEVDSAGSGDVESAPGSAVATSESGATWSEFVGAAGVALGVVSSASGEVFGRLVIAERCWSLVPDRTQIAGDASNRVPHGLGEGIRVAVGRPRSPDCRHCPRSVPWLELVCESLPVPVSADAMAPPVLPMSRPVESTQTPTPSVSVS